MPASTDKSELITLLRVAMVIPNEHCVYSPSQFSPPKTMTAEKFKKQYSRHKHKIRVCFDDPPDPETIYQHSQRMTAYGFGIDCWYIRM